LSGENVLANIAAGFQIAPELIIQFVMAGHSRPKDGVASARLRPGHPRIFFSR
jgi:hypothetical protein